VEERLLEAPRAHVLRRWWQARRDAVLRRGEREHRAGERA
jgi:hypothetical protein